MGTVSLGAPSIGPGLGGGGGNWRANLAPTPEILARVAALPPVRDVPDVDLDRESRPERRFSLPRLLAQFRAPLLVGLLLVILDALASLAGPVLVKTGVDNGVRVGSQGILFALNMALFTEQGDVHPVASIRAWMADSGLAEPKRVHLKTSPESLVLAARRP